MRATRAYIAGFGTAGSLLAGAAILFVFASALVSFKGWPQVAEQGQPIAVVPSHSAPDAGSVKRLAAVTGTRAAGLPRAATSGAVARPHGSRTSGHTAVPSRVGFHANPVQTHVPRVHPRTPAAPVTPPPAQPTTQPSGCTGAACAVHNLGSTLAGATEATTAGLGKTVANTGDTVGAVVGGVTGSLANGLAPGAPGLANVVRGAGTALDGTVTNATGALGNTVAGAGKVVGGLLAGPGH